MAAGYFELLISEEAGAVAIMAIFFQYRELVAAHPLF
jgi:hypothetical protein